MSTIRRVASIASLPAAPKGSIWSFDGKGRDEKFRFRLIDDSRAARRAFYDVVDTFSDALDVNGRDGRMISGVEAEDILDAAESFRGGPDRDIIVTLWRAVVAHSPQLTDEAGIALRGYLTAHGVPGE